MPTLPAATLKRPESRALIATLKPSPTSPSTWSSLAKTSSKPIAAVSEPCKPIFPWISVGWKPSWSVSTRKHARPRCFFSGSVWAKIRATCVVAHRDPHLRPVDLPAAVAFGRPRPLVGGVGPGVGLGQAEAAEPLAAAQLRQVVLLLLLGAPAQDRAADERRLHADHRAHRAVDGADLLDHQPVGDVVQARAAVIPRDDRPEIALFGDLLGEIDVEMVLACVLVGPRAHDLVGELPRGLADQLLLVGEAEIHRAGTVHSRGRGASARPLRGDHDRAGRWPAAGPDPARPVLSRLRRRAAGLASYAFGRAGGPERDRRPRPDARGGQRASPRARRRRADRGGPARAGARGSQRDGQAPRGLHGRDRDRPDARRHQRAAARAWRARAEPRRVAHGARGLTACGF